MNEDQIEEIKQEIKDKKKGIKQFQIALDKLEATKYQRFEVEGIEARVKVSNLESEFERKENILVKNEKSILLAEKIHKEVKKFLKFFLKLFLSIWIN